MSERQKCLLVDPDGNLRIVLAFLNVPYRVLAPNTKLPYVSAESVIKPTAMNYIEYEWDGRPSNEDGLFEFDIR